MKKIDSADFLKEFEQSSSLLQIFTSDVNDVSDINTDGKGAYLTSRNTNKFTIATTIKLVLFVETSVANYVITKDCPETHTIKFTSHRIRS